MPVIASLVPSSRLLELLATIGLPSSRGVLVVSLLMSLAMASLLAQQAQAMPHPQYLRSPWAHNELQSRMWGFHHPKHRLVPDDITANEQEIINEIFLGNVPAASTTSRPLVTASVEITTTLKPIRHRNHHRLNSSSDDHTARQKVGRHPRQAPNLCRKDSTGTNERVCQRCALATKNPAGYHDCCRNIASAFNVCKLLADFNSRFG